MTQKRTHRFDRVGKLEAVWSAWSTRNERRTGSTSTHCQSAKAH